MAPSTANNQENSSHTNNLNPPPRISFAIPRPLRDRLLVIGSSEVVFQTCYTLPHVVTSPLSTQIIHITQERDPLAAGIGREYQYRLRINDTTNNCNAPCCSLMMKILAWNCRGAHRNEFEDIARDLLFRHDPCIFIVMDTRVASEKATEIINNLSSLNDKITVSALNHVGGMWVLWNSNQITLSRVQVSNSCIRAIASFNNNTLLALQGTAAAAQQPPNSVPGHNDNTGQV